jgi:aminomethyltransferase
MRTIALDSLHKSLGAKMGEFAGFNMPMQYPKGLKAEHLHTRAAAGLFDVSHMGQLHISAKDGSVATLHRELERALPIDFDGWPIGLQKYAYLLNDAAGIEDDLMLTFCGQDARMVVNAGNRDHDLTLLQRLAPGLNFSWIDAALLALQGPRAQEVLQTLDPSAESLKFMQTATLNLLGAPCFTSRSGYTGEDGYEISVPTSRALDVAKVLLAHPAVEPVGLGARDTLRLEAGLPLHGNDISATTHPIEAGLAFAIPKSRRPGGAKSGGYPGSHRLAELWLGNEPPKRKLVGFMGLDSVPVRAHAPIHSDQELVSGYILGEVTSGTVSPSLGRPIMLAYVDVAAYSDQGVEFHAVVRDKKPKLIRTNLPFVPKQYKR